MGGAGESLAVDRGHFSGVRTIDGDEDDSAGCGAIHARVNDYVFHAARRGLQGSVAEIGGGSIKSAECAETRKGIRIGAVRRPEVCCKDSLRAEDSQVVSLGDFRSVDDEGVTFRSHLDGSLHNFTPEHSIAVQEAPVVKLAKLTWGEPSCVNGSHPSGYSKVYSRSGSVYSGMPNR